jgi:putative nucleotidyltransferase with HDIG domain
MPETHTITMDQLKVGLYVHLDLKWFEHPFAFSKFRIKTEEQIRTIRSLGLRTVRYDPALSDAEPAAPRAPARQPAQASAEPTRSREEISAKLRQTLPAKQAMIERIRRHRQVVAQIEKAFVSTANSIREIEKNLFARPEESVEHATALIGQIVDSILAVPELAVHVMGDQNGGEEQYFHSLNVTMLSLIMAHDLGLRTDLIKALGLGALFHDIGHREIPKQILMKRAPLTKAERNFYELHCQYGVRLGEQLLLSPAVLAIIGEHHEFYDGSGYPDKRVGESIGLLSRIVVIANHFDELCNPANPADAMTPHEALSTMFTKLRSKFDMKLLQVFVRGLGVYPPGTVVQLSNGMIGMVATINTAKPMKPMLVVYDADVPKEEAILVDMEHEAEVNVAKAIRPAQLPREIYNYLNPRKQVSYYFDPGSPAGDTRPK